MDETLAERPAPRGTRIRALSLGWWIVVLGCAVTGSWLFLFGWRFLTRPATAQPAYAMKDLPQRPAAHENGLLPMVALAKNRGLALWRNRGPAIPGPPPLTHAQDTPKPESIAQALPLAEELKLSSAESETLRDALWQPRFASNCKRDKPADLNVFCEMIAWQVATHLAKARAIELWATGQHAQALEWTAHIVRSHVDIAGSALQSNVQTAGLFGLGQALDLASLLARAAAETPPSSREELLASLQYLNRQVNSFDSESFNPAPIAMAKTIGLHAVIMPFSKHWFFDRPRMVVALNDFARQLVEYAQTRGQSPTPTFPSPNFAWRMTDPRGASLFGDIAKSSDLESRAVSMLLTLGSSLAPGQDKAKRWLELALAEAQRQ